MKTEPKTASHERGIIEEYEINDECPPVEEGHRVTVRSSHGIFAINRTTGDVIEWKPETDDATHAALLGSIRRFDLAEWEQYWAEPVDSSIDILDLGYWMKDGTYEAADNEWRVECRDCIHANNPYHRGTAK